MLKIKKKKKKKREKVHTQNGLLVRQYCHNKGSKLLGITHSASVIDI